MEGYKCSKTYSFHPECEEYGYTIVSESVIKRAEKIMSKHRDHIRNTLSVDNSLFSLLKYTNIENQTSTHSTRELGFNLRLNAKNKKALEELIRFLRLEEY